MFFIFQRELITAVLFFLEMIKFHDEVGEKIIDPKKNPKGFIDTRVAKHFFGQVYFGRVFKYEEGFWSVEYDDGK